MPRLFKIVMDKQGRMWKVPVQRKSESYKLHDGYVKNFEKGLYLKKSYEYRDRKNAEET